MFPDHHYPRKRNRYSLRAIHIPPPVDDSTVVVVDAAAAAIAAAAIAAAAAAAAAIAATALARLLVPAVAHTTHRTLVAHHMYHHSYTVPLPLLSAPARHWAR